MAKPMTIHVDGRETLTVADLTTVEQCDVYRERALRTTEEILKQLDLPPGIPRNPRKFLALPELPRDIPEKLRAGLYARKIALIQLRDRRRELLQTP